MVSLHSDAQNLSRRGMQDRVKTQKLGGRFQGTATPLKIATALPMLRHQGCSQFQGTATPLKIATRSRRSAGSRVEAVPRHCDAFEDRNAFGAFDFSTFALAFQGTATPLKIATTTKPGGPHPSPPFQGTATPLKIATLAFDGGPEAAMPGSKALRRL